VYLLKRAELAVRSCSEVALHEFDLTPAQFLMLFRLQDRTDLSMADLARDIGVRPQSIIGFVAALERRGVLVRRPSPAHRRVLHLRLTVAGRRLLSDATRVAARVEAELLGGLSATHLAALRTGLLHVWERAERHAMHPRQAQARDEVVLHSLLAGVQQRAPVRGKRSVKPRS
jgi:DNA-binding MarR family transcriptional regulator